jgi:hypothetical protein
MRPRLCNIVVSSDFTEKGFLFREIRNKDKSDFNCAKIRIFHINFYAKLVCFAIFCNFLLFEISWNKQNYFAKAKFSRPTTLGVSCQNRFSYSSCSTQTPPRTLHTHLSLWQQRAWCQKMLHFYTLLFSQCVQRKNKFKVRS